MKLNCIVCEVDVENWDEAYPEGNAQVHPIGGTQFRTYGHYGSTVFDPMDASYLDIAICDDCLKARMKHTHKGANENRKKEIDDGRKEMDQIIDEMNIVELLDGYDNAEEDT